MSAYTPIAGQLFYAYAKPQDKLIYPKAFDFGGTVTVFKHRDRSYEDDVFRAIAFDDTMVVADVLTGYFAKDSVTGPRKRLLRSHYVFSPVGPDVARALSLEVDTGSAP